MFQTNCYLFGDEETKEIVIIDPGGNPGEIKKRTEKFKPIAIILTHSHPDHAGAAMEVKDMFKIPIYVNKNEIRGQVSGNENFIFVNESYVIEIGSEKLHVIDSPGHSTGGIMLVSYENKIIFTGDTLFRGSIGRTDFGGNYNTLMERIRKIMHNTIITEDFTFFPGHVWISKIGLEK